MSIPDTVPAIVEGCTMDWLVLDSGLLDESEELATSLRVALGTDALSDVDEILPDPDSTDRRGWWGDFEAELIWGGWPIGSKLWLLSRAKITDAPSSEGSTVARAKQYTEDAIRPFLDRGVATDQAVLATRVGLDRIYVHAVVFRGPLAEIELSYQMLWDEIIG